MGPDVGQRICLVTGGTSGIGFETARGIARHGLTVVVVGRSLERSRAATDRIRGESANPHVDFLLADLSVQADVRRLAAAFRERYSELHVLVNNAGGMFLNGQTSPDGLEMTLALNHLAGYLLTRLLLDLLKASAPARVVNVASVAHVGARIDFSNLRFGGWGGYKRSKLANVLFTYELARRLEGTGVTANSLHPGLVASGFGMNNRGLFPLIKPLVDCVAVTNEEGARTSIHLACSAEVGGVTGKYFVKCRPRRSSGASYDRAAAARLWEMSAGMTGLPID
jgi:NAD(P)-dependent dehydrogenase (short-subunit alcohol dehydrogenase family)